MLGLGVDPLSYLHNHDAFHIVAYHHDIITALLSLIIFYPHFYLQTVQMQVHLVNGVMGGEAGRKVPITTPL
jgi:hypothetical protein